MWLLNYVTKNSKLQQCAVKGCVSNQSKKTSVVSSSEHKNIDMCTPYGVISKPPTGENAVVLPLDDGEVGLGVIQQCKDIESGEILLRSKGGAEIRLKNNGKVLINGKVF